MKMMSLMNMEMLVHNIIIRLICTCVRMPTQYQPKEILKKYNEEIDGVKKDSIVLG